MTNAQQVLNPDGSQRTSPLHVAGNRFVLDIGLVETSIGALVTFVTSGSRSANQVAATPLRCAR